MTASYLYLPDGMNDAWQWVVAIDAWDYCDPEPLEELLRAEPIPELLRPVIADIVTGERKQNKKGAARLKIKASERMKAAGMLSLVVELVDGIKRDIIDDEYPGSQGVVMLGEREGREPIEIKRELEEEARQVIRNAADNMGVSVETVENLVRDLRDKINNWPHV